MENNRAVIFLRGLPGSGKSTLARILSEGKHPIFSIDDYFTDEDGSYMFEYQNNHLAYKLCLTNVEEAMRMNKEKIFVDNTFTLDWEIEPYFKLAADNDYAAYVVTVEKYHTGKNVHSITDEQIEKMAEKYNVKLY